MLSYDNKIKNIIILYSISNLWFVLPKWTKENEISLKQDSKICVKLQNCYNWYFICQVNTHKETVALEFLDNDWKRIVLCREL